jgi:hypothetical protein
MTGTTHGTSLLAPGLDRTALTRLATTRFSHDSTGIRIWTTANAHGAVSLSAFGTDAPMPAAHRAGLAVQYEGLSWMGDVMMLHRPRQPAGSPLQCPVFGWCEQVPSFDDRLAADVLVLWRDHGYDDGEIYRRLAHEHSKHFGVSARHAS